MLEWMKKVDIEVKKGNMPPDRLLSKLKRSLENVGDVILSDPEYLPFYYYLGQFIEPKSILEINPNSGLISSVFLIGNKSVKEYAAFQWDKDGLYDDRIAVSNLKKSFKGDMWFDQNSQFDFKIKKEFDLVLINEQKSYDDYMVVLNSIWAYLSHKGFALLTKAGYSKHSLMAFRDFCKISNRDGHYFNNRFKQGVIQK